MRWLALALALCAPARALAGDWTVSDTVLEVTAEASLAADWMLTLDIRRYHVTHPWMHETNPLLGPHPTDRAVAQWFLVNLAVHPIIARILPGYLRTAWQVGTIGLEARCVVHNRYQGLQFRVPF
jgi:hypothetical protein